MLNQQKEVLVMLQYKLGELILCQPNGVMTKEFTGRIQKVYENSAFVTIYEYDDCDEQNAADLVYRTVIAKKNITRAIKKLANVKRCPDLGMDVKIIS